MSQKDAQRARFRNTAGEIFFFFLRHACKKRKEVLSPSPLLIPGHNQSLVSGVVLDIPSSHSEAGRDVLESMTSLSLTDIFK